MNSPCVLLHGWGYTPNVWEPFRLLLGQEVLAPALSFNAIDMEEWADKFAVAIPNESVLIGWSLGASLALCLAVRHPHKVAKLVLIAATPRFVAGHDWPHGLDFAAVQKFRDDFADAPLSTLQRFVALQVLSDRRRHRVSQALLTALTDYTDPLLENGLRLLAESDLRQHIAALDLPCLLIHGSEDALMPLTAAQWLHAHCPDSKLDVIAGAGHAPFISQPKAVVALIRDFVHAR